jgi:hypothetical protein
MLVTILTLGAVFLFASSVAAIVRPDWIVAAVSGSWFEERETDLRLQWRFFVRILGLILFMAGAVVSVYAFGEVLKGFTNPHRAEIVSPRSDSPN